MNTQGMKCIGKGAFSTVYQKSKKTVLIKSQDNVKECMSLGWFPDSNLFPKIEKVATSDCGQFQFYEEKFYPKVRSLKNNLSSFDWEFYRALKNISDSNHMTDCDECREAIALLPNKFHHKRTMILEAIDALTNYGSDVCFEISPRNVAIHGKKLVLLDCFFMRRDLVKIRNKNKI